MFLYDGKVAAWLVPCILVQCLRSHLVAGLLGASAVLYAAFELSDFGDGAVTVAFVGAALCAVVALVGRLATCDGGLTVCALDFAVVDGTIWLSTALWAAAHATIHTASLDAAAVYERTLLATVSLAAPPVLARVAADALDARNDFPRFLALALGLSSATFAAHRLPPSFAAVRSKKEDARRLPEVPALAPGCAWLLALAAFVLPALSAGVAYRGPSLVAGRAVVVGAASEVLVLASLAGLPAFVLSRERVAWWAEATPGQVHAWVQSYGVLAATLVAAAADRQLRPPAPPAEVVVLALGSVVVVATRVAAGAVGWALFRNCHRVEDDFCLTPRLRLLERCVGAAAVGAAALGAPVAAVGTGIFVAAALARLDPSKRLVLAPVAAAVTALVAGHATLILRLRAVLVGGSPLLAAAALALATLPSPLFFDDALAALASASGVAWLVGLWRDSAAVELAAAASSYVGDDLALDDDARTLAIVVTLWAPLALGALHARNDLVKRLVALVALGSIGAYASGRSAEFGACGSLAALLLGAPALLTPRRSAGAKELPLSPWATRIGSSLSRRRVRILTTAVVAGFAVVVVAAPGNTPNTKNESYSAPLQHRQRDRARLAALALWATSAAQATRLVEGAPEALRFATAALACAAWAGAGAGCVFSRVPQAPYALCAAAGAAAAAYGRFAPRFEAALVALVVAANSGTVTVPIAAALIAAAVIERDQPGLSLRLYFASAACCAWDIAVRRSGLALAFCCGSAVANVSMRRALAKRLDDTLRAVPKATDSLAPNAAALGAYVAATFVFAEVRDLGSIAGAVAAPLLLLLDLSDASSISLVPQDTARRGLRGMLARAKFVPALIVAFAWLFVRTLLDALLSPRNNGTDDHQFVDNTDANAALRDLIPAAICLPAWVACAQLSLAPDATSWLAILAWPLCLCPVIFATNAAPKLLGATVCLASAAQSVLPCLGCRPPSRAVVAPSSVEPRGGLFFFFDRLVVRHVSPLLGS